jgi:hypothetical protein
MSLNGGPLFSAWCLLASDGTHTRTRPLVPGHVGPALTQPLYRTTLETLHKHLGPRREQGCFLRLLAPPGSVLPAHISLRELLPGRGWEIWGVDGGGGVAEWAKAIPALEALDYRLL